MNRMDEYLNLLEELENTPAELEYTLTRAKAKARRRHIFMITPLSSLATFIIVFIIVANTSMTFVHACARVPILKEFAKLVTLSPSLAAAIENQYVQPMKLEETKNDITAKVEYIIVDQKQLNIFYSLDSKIYSNMDARVEIKAIDGKDLEGYGLHTPMPEPGGKLTHITADFIDNFIDINVPGGIELVLKVSDRGKLMDEGPAVSVMDSLLTDGPKEGEPDYISEFKFKLEFDPNYTSQGQEIIFNREFEIDGQKLTIATVEIYPTHMSFNFKAHEDNTAWLQSLDFYLENEKGQFFEGVSNGISATGDENSPAMLSHRLESTFFSNSNKLTLHITGVTWLDKDMEKVKLNLASKEIEALPQGVKIESISQKENSWFLVFSEKENDEGKHYQLWNWDYYDEEGTAYHINGFSSSTGSYFNEESQTYVELPGRYYIMFALKDYTKDVVYLSPNYSRIVELAKPITIEIK